jgi:SAM-dependent methyltransferase
MRPFSFSAALDLSLGFAMLNLTAAAHRRATGGSGLRSAVGSGSAAEDTHGGDGRRGSALSGMRVLDPCCGSGTVAAVAAAMGAAAVWGSDLRLDFLQRAVDNFAHVKLTSTLHDDAASKQGNEHDGDRSGGEHSDGEAVARVNLFEQNAKQPFPQVDDTVFMKSGIIGAWRRLTPGEDGRNQPHLPHSQHARLSGSTGLAGVSTRPARLRNTCGATSCVAVAPPTH